MKQLIEYDAIIIECETWEKLKRYYTRERIIRRIDYNLNTLCKKWNIKAELLTENTDLGIAKMLYESMKRNTTSAVAGESVSEK